MATRTTSSKSKKRETEKYKNLQDLLVLKLQSLYDIENQISKALPKMAKYASDDMLKTAFRDHLDETRVQVKRLEEAMELMGHSPKKQQVEAIRGLVKDADWIFKNVKSSKERDAILISAAQYVEHYEMAGYGSVIEWANELELIDISELLSLTLEEEKAANEKLTDLARSGINEKAV